jgi:hypothetical protein
MPNDPRTKFHEVLAVILKGVIKGLRTGLATCRFLYIASIGSAPSISLYAINTELFSLYLKKTQFKECIFRPMYLCGVVPIFFAYLDYWSDPLQRSEFGFREFWDTLYNIANFETPCIIHHPKNKVKLIIIIWKRGTLY